MINKVARTARRMPRDIERQPTPEELVEKLAMPLDEVHWVLAAANRPIRLDTAIGEKNPGLFLTLHEASPAGGLDQRSAAPHSASSAPAGTAHGASNVTGVNPVAETSPSHGTNTRTGLGTSGGPKTSKQRA